MTHQQSQFAIIGAHYKSSCKCTIGRSSTLRHSVQHARPKRPTALCYDPSKTTTKHFKALFLEYSAYNPQRDRKEGPLERLDAPGSATTAA